MGEVLSGYDDRLDRPVALKCIRPDARDPETARRRFRREARAAARLAHSAIVQVYDWVEDEDADWLVMELVDGQPLDELLADGPLPSERAAAIARDVASGLAAAHDAGFVHRDLKAANVIVTAAGGHPGRAKILDFGIAKAVEAGKTATLTADGQVVGTVRAMSPEQALGRPVDPRSDLFSLGTLLYEMLSGVSPFKGGTAAETLTRICTAKEKPLHRRDPEIPEDLSRLVGQLLEKERARRPSSARQVVTELERLIAPSSVDAATPADQTTLAFERAGALDEAVVGAASQDSTATAKPRRRMGLAVVGVVILVALWGLWSWLGPSGEESADADAPSMAAGLPDDETGFSSHQLYQRGMAYLERYDRKGNIEKAIADFHRALAQDEGSASALAGLARAYWLDFHSGSKDPQRLEQALAAARQAVKLDEYLAIARVSLGTVYFEMGRGAEAAAELEHALQLEPLNADAHLGLAKLHDSQGLLQEAERHIQKAIEARPDGWYYLAWLGTLYLKTGRHEEAEEVFRRNLERASDNSIVARNLGVSYYMQGKLAEAATQFQQALQIQPDETLYSNLGTIYFAQGLYSQSVSAYEKAAETDAGANDYLLWGNLGDAYRWTPDNELRAREAFMRAIQLLRKRLAAAPKDVTLRTRMAVYLAKRGDCDQALADVAAVADMPSDAAVAWSRVAVANEICGQRDAALAALAKALQAGYPITEVESDPELLKLRQDVRYHRLAMSL